MNNSFYSKSVLDFGAVGDGITDDSRAFQEAFDSGLPHITIPMGQYLIGKPLKIGSDIKVSAHERAHIKLGDHVCTKRGDFLLTNNDTKNGNCNIYIEGGIWDGNNLNNPRAQEMFDDNGYSGALMNFSNVKNLTLSGMTLQEPTTYYVRLMRVNGFLIEDIKFKALNICLNSDGIHMCGFCENGTIRNITAITPGTPSDDMIAFNADDICTRIENLDMEQGYIRNVTVDNIYAENCQSFIRLLSIFSDITNIKISNVRGGCYGMAVNMDAARYCCTPIIDENSPEYRTGVGCVENVSISHMHVYHTSFDSERYYMRLESNMRNFSIRDFKRLDHLESNPDTTTMLLEYIAPSEVLIEGVNDDQTKSALSSVEGECIPYTTRVGKKANALKIKTKTHDKIHIPNGDFDYLYINQIL